MKRRLAWIPLVAAGLAACATHPPTIPPVASVDLPRFMGDWYVIAHIPTPPEREAYDAVESYRLDAEGRIRTTFRYRKGGFDAPLETMEPVGTVVPGTRTPRRNIPPHTAQNSSETTVSMPSARAAHAHAGGAGAAARPDARRITRRRS